jgi:hypothetical protein
MIMLPLEGWGMSATPRNSSARHKIADESCHFEDRIVGGKGALKGLWGAEGL